MQGRKSRLKYKQRIKCKNKVACLTKEAAEEALAKRIAEGTLPIDLDRISTYQCIYSCNMFHIGKTRLKK